MRGEWGGGGGWSRMRVEGGDRSGVGWDGGEVGVGWDGGEVGVGWDTRGVG